MFHSYEVSPKRGLEHAVDRIVALGACHPGPRYDTAYETAATVSQTSALDMGNRNPRQQAAIDKSSGPTWSDQSRGRTKPYRGVQAVEVERRRMLAKYLKHPRASCIRLEYFPPYKDTEKISATK